MANRVDLNQLRRVMLNNQDNNVPTPTQPAQKVYVAPDGDIRLGNETSPLEARRLSEVNQGTFYVYGDMRHSRDQVTASTKMPANTRALHIGNIFGYSYSITCTYRNPYTFFAYFDGTAYQVSLVSPNLEGQYGEHTAHLYNDGRLCLGEGGGMPTLESAYAKSVIWATGFSVVRAGGTFPFSNNH